MGALSRYEVVLEWAMSESVTVRCPACRREHLYAAPVYPCPCGTPVAPTLDPLGTATPVVHRSWDDEWVHVPCPTCGHDNEWPRPELGCPCGVLLRVSVTERDLDGDADAGGYGGKGGGGGADEGGDGNTEADAGIADAGMDTDAATGTDMAPNAATGRRMGADTTPDPTPSSAAAPARGVTPDADVNTAPAPKPGPDRSADVNPGTGTDADPTPGTGTGTGTGTHAHPPAHTAPTPRRPFQPTTIRTARDAVTAAAVYLRWLGYRDIRRADQRPPSGIGIAAHGLIAQVDPTVAPASLRDVECLWLTAMTESAACVYFSLAGYAPDARARADSLGVPLFVLDLTGTPRPVNSLADDLDADGAR